MSPNDLYTPPNLDSRREKLIALGPEVLADALLQVSGQNSEIENLIDRLISLPEENLSRFKKRLARLRNMRKPLFGRASMEFGSELRDILEDLKSCVRDPREGVKLVADFYRTDKRIFEHCDDSSGFIADLFRYEAKELFVTYASACNDKARICDLLIELSQGDEFGIRASLFDRVNDFLPEDFITVLIDKMWLLAENNKDHDYTWLSRLETIAVQIKDASLFIRSRIAHSGQLFPADYIKIARIYLDADDAVNALEWLNKMPSREPAFEYDRKQILLAAYNKLGDKDNAGQAAWEIFKEHRNSDNLNSLLECVGQDKKEEIIDGETAIILQEKELSYTNVSFLIQNGRIDQAEIYVFDKLDQIDGDYYTSVHPLAEEFEKNGRYLTAAILFRALLESILNRAQSRYYHHGVRYLKKLDELSMKIDNWGKLLPHSDYFESIKQKHIRKTSFWGKYEC